MKSTLFFILFTFILAGCSKKSDKDYMDSGEKSMQAKNFQSAVKSYESLIKEYPDSKLAPDALVKLATLYQNRVDSSLTEEQSFTKAAELFREVYDKYPNSDKAPVALFMSGFVLSNNLGRFDEATKTYKLFLEKYPNNQLAKSAQEELNNMGLSPEEVLKKNKTKGI